MTSATKEIDTFVSTTVIEVEFWGFRLNLASRTACRTVLVRREARTAFVDMYDWVQVDGCSVMFLL